MLHRRLSDRGREAMAWQGTGETYRRLGRHEEAAPFNRRAAGVHRELCDPWNEALALDGLAAALSEVDEEEARRVWADAVRLLTDTDHRDPRARALRARIGQRLTGEG